MRPFFFFFPNGHHSLFFSPPPYSTWTPNVNPVVHIKMYGSFLLGLFVAFRTLSSRTKVNTFVGMNLTRLCVRAPRIGPTQKGPLGSTLIRWGPEVEKKRRSEAEQQLKKRGNSWVDFGDHRFILFFLCVADRCRRRHFPTFALYIYNDRHRSF